MGLPPEAPGPWPRPRLPPRPRRAPRAGSSCGRTPGSIGRCFASSRPSGEVAMASLSGDGLRRRVGHLAGRARLAGVAARRTRGGVARGLRRSRGPGRLLLHPVLRGRRARPSRSRAGGSGRWSPSRRVLLLSARKRVSLGGLASLLVGATSTTCPGSCCWGGAGPGAAWACWPGRGRRWGGRAGSGGRGGGPGGGGGLAPVGDLAVGGPGVRGERRHGHRARPLGGKRLQLGPVDLDQPEHEGVQEERRRHPGQQSPPGPGAIAATAQAGAEVVHLRSGNL